MKIKIKGNKEAIESVHSRLIDNSWVNSINRELVGNRAKLNIIVNDEEKAENQLLRIILSDDKVDVIKFQLKKMELEEAFMKIIEGDDNE